MTDSSTRKLGDPEPHAGSTQLKPGDLLQDRYEIQDIIGIGGMGTVYRARDKNFKAIRLVAIKEMISQINDPLVRKKIYLNYERESNILATLRHQSIPRIYVFSLKGNQSNLHDQIRMFFHDNLNSPGVFDRFESVDGDHGRIETRRYFSCSDIGWLQGKENWAGIKSITMVQRQREIDNKQSTETSYYISSIENDARKIAMAIRAHWHIENSLHWVLDVTFNEDKCRVRKDHGPENAAILRHIVLNLLKKEKSFRGSIQTKRLKAAWENSYMLKILQS